jgi:hypothetical protein
MSQISFLRHSICKPPERKVSSSHMWPRWSNRQEAEAFRYEARKVTSRVFDCSNFFDHFSRLCNQQEQTAEGSFICIMEIVGCKALLKVRGKKVSFFLLISCFFADASCAQPRIVSDCERLHHTSSDAPSDGEQRKNNSEEE